MFKMILVVSIFVSTVSSFANEVSTDIDNIRFTIKKDEVVCKTSNGTEYIYAHGELSTFNGNVMNPGTFIYKKSPDGKIQYLGSGSSINPFLEGPSSTISYLTRRPEGREWEYGNPLVFTRMTLRRIGEHRFKGRIEIYPADEYKPEFAIPKKISKLLTEPVNAICDYIPYD